MPSEKPGKSIASVKVLKQTVRVFFDEERLDLSHDAYTNHYLYVGKTLSDKEYAELKDASETCTYEKYARNLLSKGLYTRKQVVDRLYARQAKRWMVESIVARLESEGLIDDRAFMEERLEYGHARNEGFHHIREDLIQKGINPELVAAVVLDEETEAQKALVWLPRLLKQYGAKSSQARKHGIYDWYLRHGFDGVTIARVINEVEDLDGALEMENLRRDLASAKRKYASKYRGRQLKDRLYKYLAQRGYNYSKIATALGACEHEMD
ncbi:MAG: RecX family transcriptional regulator [Bacilli bacterium]